jgi:hypothetical protein
MFKTFSAFAILIAVASSFLVQVPHNESHPNFCDDNSSNP